MSVDSGDFQKLITGTFNAVSQTLDISSTQQGVQVIQLSGTWVGTLIAEGSNDGVTYYPLIILSDTTFLLLSNLTINGSYTSLSNGYNFVRLRASAWTSGTVTMNVWGSEGMALTMSVGLVRGGTDGTIIGNTGSALNVAGTFWQTTQPISGTVTANQGTSPWSTQDTASNTNATSAVARGLQTMGVFNNTPTVLTTGQSGFLQLDANENLLINLKTALPTGSNVIGAVTQSGTWSTGRTWTLASGTDSVTSTQGTAAVLSGKWPVQITDGTNTMPTMDVAARAGFHKITDGTNTAIVKPASTAAVAADPALVVTMSPNSADVTVHDIVNVSSQYRSQSVTTAAVEALGAATILANRISLTVIPTNGIVYWGYSNAVTISSGTPLKNGQLASWSIGPNVHVWLISAGTVDCRITEGS